MKFERRSERHGFAEDEAGNESATRIAANQIGKRAEATVAVLVFSPPRNTDHRNANQIAYRIASSVAA